jgi:hypothetical protein
MVRSPVGPAQVRFSDFERLALLRIVSKRKSFGTHHVARILKLFR